MREKGNPFKVFQLVVHSYFIVVVRPHSTPTIAYCPNLSVFFVIAVRLRLLFPLS